MLFLKVHIFKIFLSVAVWKDTKLTLSFAILGVFSCELLNSGTHSPTGHLGFGGLSSLLQVSSFANR